MNVIHDLDHLKLVGWLAATYSLEEPIRVELLRSYTNDVYLVTAAGNKTILKVYGVNWGSESDIQYEVALIEHLAKKGLRVTKPIVGKDGQKVYKILTPKGEPYAVLFEYAEGKKPQPPFSNALYIAFGQAIAGMHEFSNDFVTQYKRKPLDLTAIIESPLKVALSVISNTNDRIFLEAITEKIQTKMMAFNRSELDWGPIHGDATLDNLHMTDEGQIVLYDFDSGGQGWRAADLQGWAYNNAEYTDKWTAFQQGYASVRELKALDLEAARYLSVAWLIWGLQIDLEQRVLAQGAAKVDEYLTAQLGAIKAQAQLAFG